SNGIDVTSVRPDADRRRSAVPEIIPIRALHFDCPSVQRRVHPWAAPLREPCVALRLPNRCPSFLLRYPSFSSCSRRASSWMLQSLRRCCSCSTTAAGALSTKRALPSLPSHFLISF